MKQPVLALLNGTYDKEGKKKKIVELILQKEDSVAINRNTFDV